MTDFKILYKNSITTVRIHENISFLLIDQLVFHYIKEKDICKRPNIVSCTGPFDYEFNNLLQFADWIAKAKVGEPSEQTILLFRLPSICATVNYFGDHWELKFDEGMFKPDYKLIAKRIKEELPYDYDYCVCKDHLVIMSPRYSFRFVRGWMVAVDNKAKLE